MLKNFRTYWLVPLTHTIALLPMAIVLGSAVITIGEVIHPLNFLEIAGAQGDVALTLFTAMLACTPIYIVTGWKEFTKLRKPLGLYVFMYSAVHYLIFTAAFKFNLGHALEMTFASFMLTFGLIALILLAPLAVTSTKWAMRMLGPVWKQLHYLVYAIALFIVLHLVMLGQGEITAITYMILLGIRVPPIRQAIVRWRQGSVLEPVGTSVHQSL